MNITRLRRYGKMSFWKRFKLVWDISKRDSFYSTRSSRERKWGENVDTVILTKGDGKDGPKLSITLPDLCITSDGITESGVRVIYNVLTATISSNRMGMDIDGDVFNVLVADVVVGKFFISASTGYCEQIEL